MKRSPSSKRYRQNRILILCQGKTEEIYFKSFPKAQAPEEWHIHIQVKSKALDPLKLVQMAIDENKKAEKPFNEIWCVTDTDDFKGTFKEAYILADTENIHFTFSIESFELWLLLHFKNISIDSPLGRDGYIEELKKTDLFKNYDKDEKWLQKNVTYSKLGQEKRYKAVTYSRELERKSRISKTYFKKQNCNIHRLVEFLEHL